MQPWSLLHERLDQIVVVSKSNLILIEWRLLTHYELVGILLIEFSLQKLVWNGTPVVIVGLQLRLGRALQPNHLLIRLGSDSCLDQTALKVRRYIVFFVHNALGEFDHLLLDDGNLPMVLQHFDQRLSSNGRREVLAWQFDSHVSCQLIDTVELALTEKFSIEL